MNASVLPGVTSVLPGDLQSYLQTTGWQVERVTPNETAEYVRPFDGRTVRLRVLLDRTYSDYEVRTAEALDLIARMERRQLLEVLDDLLTPAGDRIRLRLYSESTRSGSISLDESLALRANARQLVLSAAHSAITPRRHYPRLSQAPAIELLRECRETQTERGSYVASLLVPVTPAIPTGPADAEEPYARRVTETLGRALAASADIVAQGQHQLLLQREIDGISSNFLTALAGMRPVGERSFLEVHINWSRSRPRPAQPMPDVRFEQNAFSVFAEAGRLLRETTPASGLELEGYVVRLAREAPMTTSGEVVIAADVPEVGPTRVTLELQQPAYDTALEAHRDGRPVRVIGTLTKVGRTYRLREPSGFEALDIEG